MKKLIFYLLTMTILGFASLFFGVPVLQEVVVSKVTVEFLHDVLVKGRNVRQNREVEHVQD